MAYTYTYKNVYIFHLEDGKIFTNQFEVEIPNWKDSSHHCISYRKYSSAEINRIYDFIRKVFPYCPSLITDSDIDRYKGCFAMVSTSGDIEEYKTLLKNALEEDIVAYREKIARYQDIIGNM